MQARPILIRATEGGDYDELIDPRLEGNFDAQEMLCMVACAAASIRHSARRRPKMSQVNFFLTFAKMTFSNSKFKMYSVLAIDIYTLYLVDCTCFRR